MIRRTRTILFLVCVFLFFLAAPLAILYAQGYRFDFTAKKITQTGAFYFKVLPAKADIYLDGKLKKKSSLITNSALLENILPKTYKVEIKKEGYHPWRKSLTIQQRTVTEAKNVILFSQNPGFAIVKEELPTVMIAATSSDGKKVVEADNHEIRLVFPETKEKIFLTRFSEKIGKVFWLNDHYLIFNAGGVIKIIETDDRDGLNIVDLAEFEDPEIFWNASSKKLYVLSEEKLYLLENLLP